MPSNAIDWRHAYHTAIRDEKDELRRARAEARRTRGGKVARAYVPSEQRMINCADLSDSDIDEVARQIAERSTTRALNNQED